MKGFNVPANICYYRSLVRAGIMLYLQSGPCWRAEQGLSEMLDLPLEIAAVAEPDERLTYSHGALHRNGVLPGRFSTASAASIVALVGLTFEARIAAGPQVLVVCRGAETEVADTLQRAVRAGCRSIVSFGIAGGLDPDLRAGDCIIASDIADARQLHPTDATWSRKLADAIPGARPGRIVGVDSIVAHPAAKRDLYLRTDAVAVDMESHIVARVAADHKLAFTAIRVVLDPAHRLLPEAAILAANGDGSVNLTPVLRAIFAYPSQLPALIQLALDAYAARSALVRLRQLLGPGFGLSRLANDLGQPIPANQPVPI